MRKRIGIGRPDSHEDQTTSSKMIHSRIILERNGSSLSRQSHFAPKAQTFNLLNPVRAPLAIHMMMPIFLSREGMGYQDHFASRRKRLQDVRHIVLFHVFQKLTRPNHLHTVPRNKRPMAKIMQGNAFRYDAVVDGFLAPFHTKSPATQTFEEFGGMPFAASDI